MKKSIAVLLALILYFTSFLPVLQTVITPQKVYAEENCIYDGQSNIQMLFQGQQLDPESSLYYLRARYYDPFTGRFISRDPVKGHLTQPQTQNPYAYALNNPNSYSDPSGEFAQIVQVGQAIGRVCLPIAGKIMGYTEHGLNQAIGRDGGSGVNPSAILNAVKNPVQVINKVDKFGRESIQYIGDKATVVLNKAGEIVTLFGQPRNPSP